MPCKVQNSISCYLLGHFRYIGYVLLKKYILFYHEILILAPIRKKERYVFVVMSYAPVIVISRSHYKIHCTSMTEILPKQHKTRIYQSINYKNDKYHYFLWHQADLNKLILQVNNIILDIVLLFLKNQLWLC